MACRHLCLAFSLQDDFPPLQVPLQSLSQENLSLYIPISRLLFTTNELSTKSPLFDLQLYHFLCTERISWLSSSLQ